MKSVALDDGFPSWMCDEFKVFMLSIKIEFKKYFKVLKLIACNRVIWKYSKFIFNKYLFESSRV